MLAAAEEIVLPGAPHTPVLLDEVCAAARPLQGAVIVDATFGAGGYSRAFLDGGAAHVVGIDRDPGALAAAAWARDEPRLTLAEGTFGGLDEIAAGLGHAFADAVVMDIGVSSMQLDQAARGFSFLRDGPLDMRMSGAGISAADLVNKAAEATLADIIYQFGEDRASRRIARAIVRAREEAPVNRTVQLAEIVAGCLPKPRQGQIHPATRTFQALRIAVNDELGELTRALFAAERLLSPGGRLVVVSFHSLEDRIVKRYLQTASAAQSGGSRYGPPRELPAPRFERPRRPVVPGDDEIAGNPRARSARLRSAVRTTAPAVDGDAGALGVPALPPLSELLGRGRR